MIDLKRAVIVARLSGHPIGSDGFNEIWNNEALKSAFLEVENDNENKIERRSKAMVEGMQHLYNLIDQYATMDLSRNGYGSYNAFNTKSLGQRIAAALRSETGREIAVKNAMNLADTFNRMKQNGDRT